MRKIGLALVIAAILGVVQPSSAMILNFDDLALNNWDPIPAGYGSSGTIQVSYRSLNNDLSVYSERLLFWNDDYADLHKVAFSEISNGVAELTFTATGGADLVRLNNFQMGGWPNVNIGAGLLQVLDGSGNLLVNWAPYTISGSTASSFSPDVAAESLRIRWGYNWNIGIDNIDITSENRGAGVVPEPSTLLLLAAGLLGLVGLNRRRIK